MTGHQPPVPLEWHAIHAEDVAAHWQVDPDQGLTHEDAASRLRDWGPNRMAVPRSRSALLRLLSQFGQPLLVVLLAAGAVAAALGQWVDAWVIFAVVLINAVAGFIQEGKAQAALDALAGALGSDATVLREGSRIRVDSAAVVPGDVVVLAAGGRVPADVRLLSGCELRTAEAVLTGESEPVHKHNEAMDSDTPLADRRNMGYGGTLVLGGQALGVVVATGADTESGRIAGLIRAVPELATPLTRRMNQFARQLLVAILAVAALTFAVGVARGGNGFDMFMAAVALVVSAIPAGLPAAMTIVLAIGVSRMARRNAIVCQLPAVETLGSTTVICSSKTGTLTRNAMTVRKVWAGGRMFDVGGSGYEPVGVIAERSLSEPRGAPVAGALREVLLAGVLCNDARLLQRESGWMVEGDPTEAALLAVARKAGLDEAVLGSLYPRADELPFDPIRQFMATAHEIAGLRVVYAKGALEQLLPSCDRMVNVEGREAPLDLPGIEAQASRMTHTGLRVLALVRGRMPSEESLGPAHLDSELVFLGLVGMTDPPRPDAIAAVRACQTAGIRVKMITGDHPGTAIAIARQMGIVRDDAQDAVTGRELDAMDDEALQRVVAERDVFARVEPEQKLRLVRALQNNGEVVAMTGEGVNDAAALKQADIGVAMGLGGTDVAREAAAIVLTDDRFATLEAAIEEGRGVWDNLMKFMAWTLPTHAGKGLMVLTAVLAGVTLPMAPLQILWINMTTAVLLGMMLAFEPIEPGVMLRPPRPPSESLLDRSLMARTLLVSVFMLGGAFGLFELALHRGHSLEQARTMACNLFVLIETFYLFNCRSLSRPFWAIGAFSNAWVWLGAAAMLSAQFAFTYLPWFNRIFHTAPLALEAWLWILGVAVACATAVELHKRMAGALRTPRDKVTQSWIKQTRPTRQPGAGSGPGQS